MKKLSIPAVLIALALSLLVAEGAVACSCLAPPQSGKEKKKFYEKSLKRSDGAITGKVIKRRVDEQPDAPGIGEAVFVFRIRDSYGSQQLEGKRRVRVRTALGGSVCGLEYRVGDRAGLFLHENKGELSSSICSTAPRWRIRQAGEAAGSAQLAKTVGDGKPPCSAAAPA